MDLGSGEDGVGVTLGVICIARFGRGAGLVGRQGLQVCPQEGLPGR